MEMSRRQFTAAAAMTLAIPMIPGAGRAWGQSSRPTFLEWDEVRAGAWAAIGGGGNSLFVKGSGGESLLIDCKNCGYGKILRTEIKGMESAASLVINTHHHADHSGGNVAFTEDTRLVAHEKARPRVMGQVQRYKDAARATLNELAKSDSPGASLSLASVEQLVAGWDKVEAQDFAPTETVSGDHSFNVGGVEVLVRHTGNGHTDNDLFIYIPSMNILHTGDLLFNEMHPYMDTSAGVNMKGWIEALHAMHDLCDESTVVIPGHGEVCDRDALMGQVDYFKLLERVVTYNRDKLNKTREEIVEIVPSGMQNYGLKQLLSMNLGLIYDDAV